MVEIDVIKDPDSNPVSEISGVDGDNTEIQLPATVNVVEKRRIKPVIRLT